MKHSYRLNPLLSRLRGKVGLPNDLQHGAARSWVIDPGGPKMSEPALFDSDDLRRVSGVIHDWHSIADEIEKVRGGPGVHAPMIAYELSNATLSEGHVFTRKVAHPVQGHPMPHLARRVRKHVPHAILASTGFGLKWFGHWMFDDLPLTLAALEMGEPISALTSLSPHQREYLEMLGVAPPAGDDIYFDRLVVLQDFGQNAHKRRRHDEVHRRIVGDAPQLPPGRGVMILRGDSGQRRGMTNEPEVATALSKRGFIVLDPQRLTAAEMVAQSAGADIVVGVEGSQLAHGIVGMRRGGTLLTMQPPARFSSIWKSICEGRDMRYGFVVGHAQGSDFSVNIDALNRLIDRVPPVTP
jgi:hypothetical protein